MHTDNQRHVESSFKHFVFNIKENKIIIATAVTVAIIQFCIFKYLYPYPNFIHGDSFSYLNAAYKNASINTYLVGYSSFLRVLSAFTKSDLILVLVQYVFILLTCLAFIFTILYFYKPSRFAKYFLVSLIAFNPLFLHLGNLISSDGYFLSLSMLWLSLLFWTIFRPTYQIIVLHAIVLYLSFTTRYNAIIYPLLSVLGILFGKSSTKQKMFGVFICICLCSLSIAFTTYKYKRLTGFWQFSPFSGWQWANNAMDAYRHVDSADRKQVPAKYKALDDMIRQHFDSTTDFRRYPTEAIVASTFYMWTPGMPLMKYRDSLFRKDTTATEFRKWATMGPLYKEYGMHIIKKYPYHFLHWFIWPNAHKYYAPPVEFLESYNSWNTSVDDIVKIWFEYKDLHVRTRMRNPKTYILNIYPILSGMVNALMLCTILCFIALKGWRMSYRFNTIFTVGTVLWILNAVFTICASPGALRFQAFPLTFTTMTVVLVIDWIGGWITHTEQEKRLSEGLLKTSPKPTIQ